MSVRCEHCGAVASYGNELGHKSDCASLRKGTGTTDFSKLRALTPEEVSELPKEPPIDPDYIRRNTILSRPDPLAHVIGWALWHPEGGVAVTTVFASRVQAQSLLDRRPDKVGWKPVPVAVEPLPDCCASDQSKCGKLSWPWCIDCPHAGFEPGVIPASSKDGWTR